MAAVSESALLDNAVEKLIYQYGGKVGSVGCDGDEEQDDGKVLSLFVSNFTSP
jgi:hypothetical protein